MIASEVVKQLEAQGSTSFKKILMNHGAIEPVLGVKIADLKKIDRDRPVTAVVIWMKNPSDR